MPFDIDFQQKATIKFHIRKFLLYPDFWADTNNHFPITLNWHSCLFNSANHTTIPLQKGIYCFAVKPDMPSFFETCYLFYAGKTNRTLSERFEEYLDDLAGKGKPRPKVFEMLKIYNGFIHFYYAEIPTTIDVDTCEEKLLNTFVPQINTQIPIAKIKPELKYIYE